MKAHIKAFGGAVTIEVEGKDQKELVQAIASWQEILSEKTCGACNSADIQFQYRLADGKHKYYELKCNACKAEFGLGQRQDAPVLFPKRRSEDGKHSLPNRGWKKYDPSQDQR